MNNWRAVGYVCAGIGLVFLIAGFLIAWEAASVYQGTVISQIAQGVFLAVLTPYLMIALSLFVMGAVGLYNGRARTRPADERSRSGSPKKRVRLVYIIIGIVAVGAVASILVLGLTLAKLQIVDGYFEESSTGGIVYQCTKTMIIHNTGILPVRLDPTGVFLNGKPPSAYTAENVTVLLNGSNAPLTLWPGRVVIITIALNTGPDFVFDTDVGVMFRTTVGDLTFGFSLMSPIIERYMKFQITRAYPALAGNQYIISLNIKNIGTAVDTLDPTTVFLNGNLTNTYTADNVKVLFNGTGADLLLQIGDDANGTITMNSGTDFVSGMTVNVIVQTISGQQYPTAIILP